MQVYDFTVPTNGSFPIGAVGRYIKYLSGDAGGSDATIKVQAGRNGETAILKPGQALTFPASWNDFTLSSYAATQAIIGKVLIGNGRMDDATVQGLVQVVDGGKSRSLSGSAFVGLASCAGVAAQQTNVQLWNPAGSGVRLVLEQIITVSATATGFNHGPTNVQLASLMATSVGPKQIGSSAVPVGQARISNTAGGIITTTNWRVLTNGPINVSSLFKPTEPIVIPPGWGWTISTQAQNVDETVTFEWYEELNV